MLAYVFNAFNAHTFLCLLVVHCVLSVLFKIESILIVDKHVN